jgi:hypothetical protein
MIQEIFKDIENSNGIYQVSNLGNVRSYNKNKDGKILSAAVNQKGYLIVNLRGDIRKTSVIHRLVAKAFLPNPENKKEVNHINGIKNDNRLDNLEWVTPSENVKHAYSIGLKKAIGKKGKDNILSIPVTQLTLDGIIVGNFAGAKEAARLLGAHQSGISKCCKGENKTAFGFKWQYKL